jgi:hypothetical protein
MIVNNPSEGTWKEAVMVQIMIIFRHIPGGTEKCQERPAGILDMLDENRFGKLLNRSQMRNP